MGEAVTSMLGGNAAAFYGPQLSPHQQKALLVLGKIKLLALAGGTDYSTNTNQDTMFGSALNALKFPSPDNIRAATLYAFLRATPTITIGPNTSANVSTVLATIPRTLARDDVELDAALAFLDASFIVQSYSPS